MKEPEKKINFLKCYIKVDSSRCPSALSYEQLRSCADLVEANRKFSGRKRGFAQEYV